MEQDRTKPLPTYLPGPGEPPIKIPIAGPGIPRYARVAPSWAVWLIPAAVIVVTILAILFGALWR